METKEIKLGECVVIEMPVRAIVNTHKETQAKFTAFGFAFPDGYPGTLVVTKGIKTEWLPGKQIKRIIIEFHEA